MDDLSYYPCEFFPNSIKEVFLLVVRDADFFIAKVRLQMKNKYAVIIPYPHGEGLNTAVGVRTGEAATIKELLNYRNRIQPADVSRMFHVSEVSARASAIRKLRKRVERLEQRIEQAELLLDYALDEPPNE